MSLAAASGLIAGLMVAPAHGAPVASADAPDGRLGTWSALGTGTDATVWSIALGPDGHLYAGGNFTQAGGNAASGVAMWSGTAWSQVGDGLDDAIGTSRLVSSLRFSGNLLYATGGFSRSGAGPADDTGVAVFDGSTWSAVGGGVQVPSNGNVLEVLIDGTDVYVAGEFTQAGPLPADDSNVAMWNGTTWSNLGGGFPRSGEYSRVMAMTSTGDLVVGGLFTQAGPGAADDTNIAVWNGTAWFPLAGGLGVSGDQVYSLAVGSDDTIYAGGNFSTADNGAVAAKGIALWDGTIWRPLGSGVGINSGSVRSIVPVDERGLVYVGGNFTSIDGVTVNRVAVWDRVLGEWLALTDAGVSGVSGGTGVESLAVRGAEVFMGGTFTSAGPVAGVGNTARWVWDAPEGTNVLSSTPGSSVAITGEGFIGVPVTGGVYIGGVASPSYVRDDSANFSSVVIPADVYGTVSIEVDAVGGRASVGTVTLPERPAPVPATPPTSVVATGGDASASVTWSPPASSGSFGVTNYQVTAAPGGRSCLTGASARSCEVTGLVNGATYTFTVRALTGAGWSGASAPSNPVTPMRMSILITGSRDGRQIRITGTTTGLGTDAILRPWLRVQGGTGYTRGAARIVVSDEGSFEWTRRASRGIEVYVATEDSALRSNTVTLRR